MTRIDVVFGTHRVTDAVASDSGYINGWTFNLGGGTPPPPPPPPACGGTNGADVSIPDNGATVTSTITVSGCTGNASTSSTVEVHIVHTYIGDLIVTVDTGYLNSWTLSLWVGAGFDSRLVGTRRPAGSSRGGVNDIAQQ